MVESPSPNGSSLTVFDVEQAIRTWRAELAGHGSLRLADLDELESHLRDELEGLAEVGLEGRDAFVHAVSKLGAAQALGDEFGRGNPLFAWRLPGLLFLAGALLHLLGDAGRSIAEASFRLLGTTLELGVVAGQIAQVIVLVVPPVCGILGIVLFAQRLMPGSATVLPRVLRDLLHVRPRLACALRLGVVVGLGLVVFLADAVPFPSSIHRLDAERLRVLNSWNAIAAPTYRLVWRVLPCALAVALTVTRRLATRGRSEKRAAFWMLAGLLVYDLCSTLSSASSTFSMLSSNLSGASPIAAGHVAWTMGVGVPVLLLSGALAVWQRLPPPSVVLSSRRTDVAAVLLAGTCLLATFHYHLFLFPSPPSLDVWEATLHARSMLTAAFDVVGTPILAALVWRLRSLLVTNAAVVN